MIAVVKWSTMTVFVIYRINRSNNNYITEANELHFVCKKHQISQRMTFIHSFYQSSVSV